MLVYRPTNAAGFGPVWPCSPGPTGGCRAILQRDRTEGPDATTAEKGARAIGGSAQGGGVRRFRPSGGVGEGTFGETARRCGFAFSRAILFAVCALSAMPVPMALAAGPVDTSGPTN